MQEGEELLHHSENPPTDFSERLHLPPLRQSFLCIPHTYCDILSARTITRRGGRDMRAHMSSCACMSQRGWSITITIDWSRKSPSSFFLICRNRKSNDRAFYKISPNIILLFVFTLEDDILFVISNKQIGPVTWTDHQGNLPLLWLLEAKARTFCYNEKRSSQQ